MTFIHSIKTFAVGALTVVLVASSSAFADSLPHRQKRLSINNIASTSAGSELLGQFNSLDEVYDTIVWGEPGDNKLYDVSSESLQVVLNHNLLAGAAEYISWALAMALTQRMAYLIMDRAGTIVPKDFIDLDQWAFIKAHRHWQQLGAPNHLDSVLSPIPAHRRFAESMQASVSQFHELFQTNQQRFLRAVKNRHLSLGLDSITLEKYIEQTQNPRRKKAAIALKAAIENDLTR